MGEKQNYPVVYRGNLDNFRFWEKFEANVRGCRVRTALLRVVRRYYCVTDACILIKLLHRFLTPPPTSTNVERLFSYAGLVAEDGRASLQPERLNKILFLRENIFMLNFKLDW